MIVISLPAHALFFPLFGPVFVLIFLVNLKFLSFSLSLFANEKLALIAVYPGACLTCVRRVGRWGDESRKFCATAVVVDEDEGKRKKGRKIEQGRGR